MTITMHTPGENQGQIVTVSYGSDGECIYRRIHDASDGTTEWHRVAWDDVWSETPECSAPEWRPWDVAPTLPDGVEWQPCTEPQDD